MLHLLGEFGMGSDKIETLNLVGDKLLIRMPTFVLVSLFFYCSKLWSIILSSLLREKLSKEMWKKPLNMLTKSLKVSGPRLKKKQGF